MPIGTRPSRAAWAIRGRQGRILLDRRHIDPTSQGDQHMVTSGGLSGPGNIEVLNRGKIAAATAEGGPLWLNKRDVLPFLYPGERAVRVRVEAVGG